MRSFTSFSVQIGLVLICAQLTISQSSKTLFDFTLNADTKDSDLDNPNSTIGKLIKFVVKGENKTNTDYLSIHRDGNLTELGITIKNDSIFVPGGDPKNTQFGFRRTDVLPAIDANTTLVGTTAFHASVRANTKLPFNLTHGYLLSSIELSVSFYILKLWHYLVGDHVFDVFVGSDFNSDDKVPVPTNNSRTIRVRDLTTKVLYSAPFEETKLYNFAVIVDWKANMLTVWASEGNNDLKMVAGPAMNDPKVIAPDNVLKGEWHMQLIKFPLPNSLDPIDTRSDVPHHGLQEGTTEGAFFSRIFVEDASGGNITTSVLLDGHFGRQKHGSKCKPTGT
ncbi:hypothetical protein CROQUDRAFT_97000 [Cronartium quercuum f. sp. fusiforme G11]|uniref:Glycoside hydrolase 131 catalytic N-terminal domain-containing protein n=1 Tax=Cronartium quercuum f. sp. fusiforme G11 TaxID=708437 RepID=A0A9P6T891_9BASI|nr:hypothetical protein CROQUDRAFT_97000 [Cronartium quercuum f. sp. fusiforme G11]